MSFPDFSKINPDQRITHSLKMRGSETTGAFKSAAEVS
jgi:hypothetical protein